MMGEPSELLTTEQVAELLHTSPGTIHYWRAIKPAKGPKAIKVGRRLLFRRDDVDEWLSRHESDPEAQATR
jgi:excisionase family DNA binding protein